MDQEADPGRALTPLLVGVTGKLDLKGADAEVRAALDLVLDRLDARCPGTPKLLLSSLARGADTLAAEAALARPGWRIIALLPFDEALFLEDFDQAGGERLKGLLANERVSSVVLAPLRRSEHGQPFAPSELHRSSVHNPARTDHYEQAGLFVAERAAVLIAVMAAQETPGKVGGAARIVRYRLDGELDAGAADIARRSDVLFEPPRLVDRRTGPVWLVDLSGLARAPDDPAKALMVWNPGEAGPSTLGEGPGTRASLRLPDGLEAFNQRVAGVDAQVWRALEARLGPGGRDAASQIRRIRAALSLVQGQMVRNVRQSIVLLAMLSIAAILSFELYVDLTVYAWTRWLSIVYSGLLAVAILIYGYAARQRWQPIAEDYRAAAEALRVQLIWWASGLTAREDRISRFYLRGAHGSLSQLRVMVEHIVDAALLCFDAPPLDPAAAGAWVDGQIEFFDQRIAARRRELSFVEGASWFLFGASLGVGASLAVMQLTLTLWPVLSTISRCAASTRLGLLLAAAFAIAGLLLIAIRAREGGEADDALSARSTAPAWITGIAAGVILAFSLCDLATLASAGGVVSGRPALTLQWARELIAIAMILPATIAGALRFVADKSSWAAELAGYEHAGERFRRGRDALARAPADQAAGAAERREIVLALGAEALDENEAWLRSHRERPLEPVVGG
jgi:hypothetical protein